MRRLPLILVGMLLLGTGAAPSVTATSPSSKLCVGERLVYDARVWKGLSFLGMSVGKATLSIKKSDREEWPEAYLLHAYARGGALGYSAKATVATYLDPETLLPLHASLTQRGTEVYDKQMLFQDNEAVYVKKKHCREKRTCDNPRHVIREKVSRGLFMGYDRVRKHCPKRKCDKLDHYGWRIRHRHPTDKPTYDMLSVLYICRTMDLPLNGKGEDVRIVNAHDLWDVTVRAKAREKIEVPAGKFRCILLEISPKPADSNTKLRKEFEGLFGIRGNIQVWIDEKTRIPVRIRGIVPFGVDLNMEISLTKKSIPGSPRS